MVPPVSSVHEFGPFRLDTVERLLLRAGQPVSLTPKAFDLLIYLVERHGRLITKTELLRAVWPDTFVEEANLTYTVSAVRRALGDSQDGERYIQTVPTRGYRFLAPVTRGEQPPPIPQIAEARRPPQVSRRWKEIALLSGALGTILLALLVGLATIHFREKRPDLSRVVFTVPRDPAAFPQFNLPAISPDGTRVVFFGPGDGGKLVLWSRALDSLAIQPLAGTELSSGPPYPFWSPDGHFIAFFSGGKLKKIAADGGASQELAPAPDAAGGSWGSDGTIIFSPQVGPLYRVSAAGGPATPLRELDASRGELRHVWPHFLPDGKHYLYVARSSDAEKTGIYLGTVGTQETRLLIAGESNVVYSPPGYLIFVRDGTLVAQAFGLGTSQLADGAFPLPSYGGRSFPAASTFGLFSVSQNGVLAYADAHLVDVQPTWYDRHGEVLGTIGEPGEYGTVRLAPDDKRAALERTGATAGVWVLDVATGIPGRLTFGPESDPVWSPDGREVVFSDTLGTLHRRVIGKKNDDEVLMGNGDGNYPKDWTPDGAAILFIKDDGRSLYRLPLSGSRRPELLLETPFQKDQFHVSPDGRWIAFNSLESGRWEVYAAAFPSFTDKRQVSRDGGGQPVWRNDGKELFYLSLQGKLMAVDTTLGASLEASDPAILFQVPISVNPRIDQYAVARDGQRFIFCAPGDSAGQPITVVVNWTAGLNVSQGIARVPQ
jgi:DNA-binding winged helix-turn-helix (wHTH) protein/Tol biopolymer transport system component